MVNVFPILFLAPLAHTILRVVVGFLYLVLAGRHFQHRSVLKERFASKVFPFPSFLVIYLAGVEFIIGCMFIVGYYTQIAALVSMLVTIKMILMYKKFSGPYVPSRLLYTLLFAASFSLLITGAGAFAFDLPI